MLIKPNYATQENFHNLEVLTNLASKLGWDKHGDHFVKVIDRSDTNFYLEIFITYNQIHSDYVASFCSKDLLLKTKCIYTNLGLEIFLNNPENAYYSY